MLYKRPFFIIRFLFMKHIIDIDTWTITAFSERF